MPRKIFHTFLLLLITNYLFLFSFVSYAFAAVTFSLNPAAKTVGVGDSFDVKILLDTGGQQVSGGTAVLIYDPSKLSVLDANTSAVGTQISSGTIFTNPLTNSTDAVAGKITLDYGSSQSTFSSQGTFGTISFKALTQSSSTPVSFVLTGTSGTSAVYSGGVNVLSAATNGSYAISASGNAVASPTSTPSSLPKSGAVENTIFMIVASLIFLSGGFFLFRFSRV